VILSLARFQAEGESPAVQQPPRSACAVESDEEVEALAYDLPRLSVVALAFPKYRDGRAYTSARLLRERLWLHRRGSGGGRRAAGAGRLHGPLRLRRLRARRRRHAGGLDQGRHRFRHVYQRAADAAVAFEERGE
jgi:hypothetical protein